MSDFKHRYKNPRLGFGDANHKRLLRSSKQEKSRREIRSHAFDRNRDLQDVSPSTSPQPAAEEASTMNERMKKLIKWKEERKRKKIFEDAKKKPVFKIGIVHHALSSPRLKSNVPSTAPKQAKRQNYVKKGITKVTEKRLLNKAKAQQIAETSTSAVSISRKYPTNMKKSTSYKKNQVSFAPVDHKFRPPSGLQKTPMFGLITVEETPQEKGDFFIQDVSIKSKVLNTNKQTAMSLQKLNTSVSYDTRKDSKTSIDSKLFGLVTVEETPQEKGDFFIQDVSMKSKVVNANKQTSMPLQKLNTSISHDIGKEIKASIDSKLSLNKQKSSLKLNELACDPHDKLDTTITLSPKQQTMQDSSQQNISLCDTDMKTPPQKTNLPTNISSSINTSLEKNNCLTEDLITFSPYLTLSRGKKNARKEQQQRLGIGSLSLGSDEIPTKETVMKNLNISVEEEERTAQYFKFLLNKETDRLRELCKKWLDISLENDVPDDAMYEINQATGQTNLLINKKFERFRSLVQDCETGKGEMLVTCKDLQGFWDITYMEIRNCDSRFEKLEQRRDRKWQEEECIVANIAVKKRMPAKKQIASSKPSSLRSFILAARKKKMEVGILNKEDSSLLDTNVHKKHTTSLNNRKSITEACSDTGRNMRRSKILDERKSLSTRYENSVTTLMRKKQFSDTSKKIKSPFAAMKISRMCKTPEIRLDDTISYVNSDQTPGKSILKKSEELINKEIRTKSAHKVNFDDQIVSTEVPVDEKTQIRLELSAALESINNLDSEELSPQECINVGKKLTFETEDSDLDDTNEIIAKKLQRESEKNRKKSAMQKSIDFNSSDITYIVETSSLDDADKSRKSLRHRPKDTFNIRPIDINIIPATPLLDIKYVGTPGVSKELSNRTDVQQDYDLGTRILRNRTITMNDTPKINKMMTPKKNVNKKENKSPMKTSRRSSSKLSRKDENEYMTLDKSNIAEMENVFIEDKKRRRSSRKSVAFSETCLVCTENKPVLPMTPHSKRHSKTSSRQSKYAFEKDLILWDTPDNKRLPRRVTRSTNK